MLLAARSARAELAVDPAAFAAFLARRVEDAPDPATALAELHIADLLLVFSFLAKVPGADKLLDEALGPVAARVHAEVSTALSSDEIHQELRVHLLLGDAGRPARIQTYEGRSALYRWMYVASTRYALNLARGRRRELPFEAAFFLAQPDLSTPEVGLLDEMYGGPVREAVARALARLAEREQALLWLSLVDRTPAEHIAKIYGVHRTTASRWIEHAASELRREFEAELAADAGLASSELSSVVRAVLSR